VQAENPYSIRPSDRSCEDRGAELEKVGLVQVQIAERPDCRETRLQRDQIAECVRHRGVRLGSAQQKRKLSRWRELAFLGWTVLLDIWGVLGIRGHNLPARVRLTSDLIGQ